MKKLLLVLTTLITATAQASDISNPFVDGVLEFHNHQLEDPFHIISSVKAAGQNHTGTKTEFMAKNRALFGQIEACYDRWQYPTTRKEIYATPFKNALSIVGAMSSCKKFEQVLTRKIKHADTRSSQELKTALDQAQAIFTHLLKEQKDIHPYTIDPHLYILSSNKDTDDISACMNTVGTQGFVCANIQLLTQRKDSIETTLRHELAHFVNKELDDASTSTDDQNSKEIDIIESNTNTLTVCSSPDPIDTARTLIASRYHADHLRKFTKDLQAELLEQKIATKKIN